MNSLRILRLTLLRKWFDAIASGNKKEEYRDAVDHWHVRLKDREYDEIKFVNGYGAHRPFMRVEFKGCSLINGRYVVKLGKILEIGNYDGPEIKWKRVKPGYYTATAGDYTLWIQKILDFHWRWSVDYKDSEREFGTTQMSMKAAKAYAEEYYKKCGGPR